MTQGFAGMASFHFILIGFVWVVGCAILFAGAYLVGARNGGRAAAKYTVLMTWIFLGGIIVIAAYAFISQEIQGFIETYNYSILIELVLLAMGCVWIMWFMATQYARGRIAIDERFGSKENYLLAKEAAKRAARGEIVEHLPVPVDTTAGDLSGISATFPAVTTGTDTFDLTNSMPVVDPALAPAAAAPDMMGQIPGTPAVQQAVPAFDSVAAQTPQVPQPQQQPQQQIMAPLPLTASSGVAEGDEQWLQQLGSLAEQPGHALQNMTAEPLPPQLAQAAPYQQAPQVPQAPYEQAPQMPQTPYEQAPQAAYGGATAATGYQNPLAAAATQPPAAVPQQQFAADFAAVQQPSQVAVPQSPQQPAVSPYGQLDPFAQPQTPPADPFAQHPPIGQAPVPQQPPQPPAFAAQVPPQQQQPQQQPAYGAPAGYQQMPPQAAMPPATVQPAAMPAQMPPQAAPHPGFAQHPAAAPGYGAAQQPVPTADPMSDMLRAHLDQVHGGGYGQTPPPAW
ncbi:MAG: hypothetical protein FWF11_00370 [Coriobacteriia bacterium]|nr:hypothetical protein [Coriobacteriia bacterium]